MSDQDQHHKEKVTIWCIGTLVTNKAELHHWCFGLAWTNWPPGNFKKGFIESAKGEKMKCTLAEFHFGSETATKEAEINTLQIQVPPPNDADKPNNLMASVMDGSLLFKSVLDVEDNDSVT